MGFANWDPWRDFLTLQKHLNRRLDDQPRDWAPAVDMSENGTGYRIIVELPGLTRDEFQIEVTDGQLRVRGARRSAHMQQFGRVERGHGAFERAFELSHPIMVDQISATLERGVLTIVLPTASGAHGRRITVE
jgi:HSP20 family protein